MEKIKIGLFFGGISTEHEVSLMSAEGIINNIDRKLFKVIPIWIDKKGIFWTSNKILEKVNKNRKKELSNLNINDLGAMIDVAFPILHGRGGEDGTIQGFFETLGLPYVGASILSSAICLDKAIFNQLMIAMGINKPKFSILDYNHYKIGEVNNQLKSINKTLKFPVFVKPAHTGSSVGIYKVKNISNLNTAINKAKRYDKKIVIEESIENCREIEISVLGNSINDYEISLPGRVIPHYEFYDYNDKYKDNLTEFEIPAKLPTNKIKEIQHLALKAYRITNCRGLARVDFFLDKSLKVYLNEINTMPGFTPISMYPKLWQISGLSHQDLITKLIILALKRTK